ncbi:S24 family peptidase [Enterococcus sp. AZ177]|uniref:LexA family protein n=1 Tax=unclassified Enterococcus TaxID=2608891 RepID=UPI003D2FE6BA
MEKVSPANRLHQIMSSRNLRQVDILKMSEPYQKELGVKMGKSTLSQYVTGKQAPDQDRIYLLSKTLDVNEPWLMGYNVPIERIPDYKRQEMNYINALEAIYNELEPQRQTKVYKYAKQQLDEQESLNSKIIPLVGKTAANPTVIEYGDVDIEQHSFSHVPEGADCAIYIQGDSMEPLIKDGSIVFYKRQEDVESGEIAVVEINGDGATCKRVIKDYDNRQIILRSVNDRYEDRIMHDEKVRIIGKVIL